MKETEEKSLKLIKAKSLMKKTQTNKITLEMVFFGPGFCSILL